jgi:hypothetical protein
LTLAGSAISNLHRPAGASIIDLSPLDGDFAAAAVAQLDLAEMTDGAVVLRPAPWAKPVWVLLDYVPHWQPHHLSPLLVPRFDSLRTSYSEGAFDYE